MTLRRMIAVAAFSIAACLIIAIHSVGADEPKSGGTAAKFAGKYVVVHTKDDNGASLMNTEVRMLGNREFLVGTVVAPNNRWKSYDGRILWIPIETVIQIYEFDSVDQIKDLTK